jgi:DNA-binding transcriptional LysR family regulator
MRGVFSISTMKPSLQFAAPRFGLPADFAEMWLPEALGRFKRTHPAVRIEAVVDRNRRLLELLDKGELDLVLAIGSGTGARERVRDPAAGVDRRGVIELCVDGGRAGPARSLRGALFFCQCALASLDKAGVPWRIAFTSRSLHGLWAAVELGFGVTLRTAVGLPATLRVLDGLPAIADPALPVCLHDGGRALASTPATLRSTRCWRGSRRVTRVLIRYV